MHSHKSTVHYSYGLYGYFMKYLGGLSITALIIVFSMALLLIIYLPFSSSQEFSYFELTSTILIITFMLCLLLKWGYYCFKYDIFTKEYELTENGMKVITDGFEEWHSIEDIELIVFRKFLVLFEVHFSNKPDKMLVIMNGGSDFYGVKHFFLNQSTTKTTWF